MNVETNANARAAIKYREKREAAGERQVTVWLAPCAQLKVDEMMSAGGFKNRSDLIARAIQEFELNKGN
jgi:hypothetical protein